MGPQLAEVRVEANDSGLVIDPRAGPILDANDKLRAPLGTNRFGLRSMTVADVSPAGGRNGSFQSFVEFTD